MGRNGHRRAALWEHSRHFLNLRPVYALGQWFLENLPLPVGYGITWGVAEVAYHWSPQIRQALEANVGHVLRRTRPEMDEGELRRRRRALAHRIILNRGTWFADLSVMAGRREFDGLFRFDMEGNWPALVRARASGRGAILASAHLGNWHGGGVAVARHGIPVRALMYRNHAGDVMDRKVARRGKVRQTFVDDDPLAMMELIRALRSGEVVAMLVDKPWDSRSVEVPFFGKSTRFPLGPVRLARLAEAPIFPAFCVWDRPRHYRAVLCDPIEVCGPDPDQAEREALVRMARVIEEFVASHLDVWFNFTPVWDGD
jgi:lauroyl/myristoyl acyltransferase